MAASPSGRPTHTDPVLVGLVGHVDLAELALGTGGEIGPPAGALGQAPDGELALALDALGGRPGLADVDTWAGRRRRAAEVRVVVGLAPREHRGVLAALIAAAAVRTGLHAITVDHAAARLRSRALARQAAGGVDRVAGGTRLGALHLDAREHALAEIAGGADVVGARIATGARHAGTCAMRGIVDVDRERGALATGRRGGRAVGIGQAALRGLAEPRSIAGAVVVAGGANFGAPRRARREDTEEEEKGEPHGTPGGEHDSCRSVTRRDPVVQPQFSMPEPRTIRPTA